MGMFCYQCQETRGAGARSGEFVSRCGPDAIKPLYDQGYSITPPGAGNWARQVVQQAIVDGLFSTVTNVNFDVDYFVKSEGRKVSRCRWAAAGKPRGGLAAGGEEEFAAKAEKGGTGHGR